MTDILKTVYMIMWAIIIWKESHEEQDRLDRGDEAAFSLEYTIGLLLRAGFWPIVLIYRLVNIIRRSYKDSRT